jgi:hypothetical protein
MLNKILAERVHRSMPAQVEIVRVEAFDFGNQLGVAICLADDATGKRHAVKVKIEDGDLTKAADEAAEALKEWLGA